MTKKILTIHKPVLLQEVIENLKLDSGKIIFDGTLGGGGYAKEICQKIGEKGILIGTDLDKHALGRVEERLKKGPCQKKFFLRNYSEIETILEEVSLKKIDGLVLDLGISSDQLELESRGISFLKGDEPLDMNLSLDKNNSLTAGEILNS
jgi:16S rRNA (cytosine1402-N4)-methyltransferase